MTPTTPRTRRIMIEPRPRKAVQNLKTFQAIAGPDLCITRENKAKQLAGKFSKPKRCRFRRRLRPSPRRDPRGPENQLRSSRFGAKTKGKQKMKVSWKSEDFRVSQWISFVETANLRAKGSNLAYRFLGILTEEKLGCALDSTAKKRRKKSKNKK